MQTNSQQVYKKCLTSGAINKYKKKVTMRSSSQSDNQGFKKWYQILQTWEEHTLP